MTVRRHRPVSEPAHAGGRSVELRILRQAADGRRGGVAIITWRRHPARQPCRETIQCSGQRTSGRGPASRHSPRAYRRPRRPRIRLRRTRHLDTHLVGAVGVRAKRCADILPPTQTGRMVAEPVHVYAVRRQAAESSRTSRPQPGLSIVLLQQPGRRWV
jgi:hypothetical protein